jgi:hypothetical protein
MQSAGKKTFRTVTFIARARAEASRPPGRNRLKATPSRMIRPNERSIFCIQEIILQNLQLV